MDAVEIEHLIEILLPKVSGWAFRSLLIGTRIEDLRLMFVRAEQFGRSKAEKFFGLIVSAGRTFGFLNGERTIVMPRSSRTIATENTPEQCR